MKKLFIISVMVGFGIIGSVQKAEAQIPIVDIIKAAVKAVINAVDLQIQRQQNKIIWLQNAQKTLENTMSKAKLDEIGGWVERQRTLYKDYYEELQKVKSIIEVARKCRTQNSFRLKIRTHSLGNAEPFCLCFNERGSMPLSLNDSSV